MLTSFIIIIVSAPTDRAAELHELCNASRGSSDLSEIEESTLRRATPDLRLEGVGVEKLLDGSSSEPSLIDRLNGREFMLDGESLGVRGAGTLV